MKTISRVMFEHSGTIRALTDEGGLKRGGAGHATSDRRRPVMPHSARTIESVSVSWLESN